MITEEERKIFIEQSNDSRKMNYICDNVSELSRLEQLGEECAELVADILKYLRKFTDDNPTPKSEQEILANIKEEIMDIQLCIDMVDSKLIDYDIYNRKLNRWAKRIGYGKSESEETDNGT